MPARTQQSETQATGSIEPDADFQTRLIEGSLDCIKVLDLDGRLLSMNAGGMKLLEICDLRPFVGQSWLEFWKDADREAAEAAIKAAREGVAGRFVGFFPTTQTHAPKWFDVIVSPIVHSSGKPEKILAASRDITAYKRAERSLRAIAEGTAAATGDEFFRSLARCAAQALGAQYAFVAETLSEMESRSLAFWEGTDFGMGFTYRFPGTPCQRVAAGHVCVTPSGLQEKFPEDLWLQQIGAQSYIGVPLRNAQGRTLGHLAVLHREPMEPSEEDIATLKIFAARGCAELERKHANEKLSKAHADLRRLNLETAALLNVNRAIGHNLHRDVLFGALADCLQAAVPTDRFGIVLPHEGGQLQSYILTQRDVRSESLQSTIFSREGTATEWVLQTREWYVTAARDDLRDRFPATHRVMQEAKMQSLCELPLVTGTRILGSLFFMASAKSAYEHLQRPFLEQVASAVAVALDDCLAQEEMRRLGDELSARKIAELEQQQRRMSDVLQETSKALDASEERFRDLFDEAPIAYVHEGLDSRFIRANRTALRILGVTPDEAARGFKGLSLVPDTPEAKLRAREAFESIGKGTDTSGVVLELRRKADGRQVFIQWWSRPDPEGQFTRTMFIDITDRVLLEREQARLRAQNVYLQEEIKSVHNFEEIIGASAGLLKVLEGVARVAPTDSTVLVCGETGTGKELIARAIHSGSRRVDKPFIKLNCAALPAGLIESELFGHERGAFSGAIQRRTGRFELAHHGTIFLDEIGEMPLEVQAKLLRVLQEREFERVGSSQTTRVDVRIVAASNRDLAKAVRAGEFREDLYYRLNVFPVTLPPLRERPEDIPLLVKFFVQKYSPRVGRRIDSIDPETMQRLLAYPWPGNIRELENLIERALILADSNVLHVEPEILGGSSVLRGPKDSTLASAPPASGSGT